jgi:RND superfamily putative drug exporter
MRWLTSLALRRPLAVLGVWGGVILVLSLIGLGVANRLATGTIETPGSQVARATALDHADFGPNETLPVLLNGPAGQLDRQGPRMVAQLRHRWSVLSPWDPGADSSRLRPKPTAALVLVNLTAASTDGLEARVADVKRVVHGSVTRPLVARVSGFTAIGQALRDETLKSAALAQLIAIPILVVVLLLVFRAPLAAAVPAVVGFATVAASAGLIALLAHWIALTALAVSATAMMGLALGVDYSLLIVSRFREELAAGNGTERVRAARIASATAGRTVVFAGSILLIAMLVAVVLSPGDVLVSLTVGVTVAVVLSVLSGAVIVPALLVLLGGHVDRWRIGSPTARAKLLPALAGFAVRHAGTVLAGSLVLLLALATPALDLHTAALNPRFLPADDHARQDFERVSSLVGYGYVMPFEIALHAPHGLIAEPRTLASIERFERRILRDPDIVGVVGPGALATRAGSVLEVEHRIPSLQRQARRATVGVARLRSGLAQASRGAGSLRDGAAHAQTGVARLQTGAQQLGSGAAQLSDGVRSAASGTLQLAQGASSAARGAVRLQGGTTAARAGSDRLLQGIGAVETGTAELDTGTQRLAAALLAGSRQMPNALGAPIAVTGQQLRAAYDALARMTVGRDDPTYTAALAAVSNAAAMVSGTNPQTGAHAGGGVPGALAQASAQLQTTLSDAGKLSAAAAQLRGAVHQLHVGASSLTSGLDQLEQGQSALSDGLSAAAGRVQTAQSQFSRLTDGADRLAQGTSQLTSGLGQLGAIDQLVRGGGLLAWRLFEGYRASAPLVPGLRRSSRAIKAFPSLRGERAAAHLVLAGIESTSAARRSQAQYVLDVAGAGQGARVFAFPSMFPASDAGAHVHDRLSRETAAFARANGLEALLGGPASRFTDFQRVVSAFVPLLIACLSLITYVLLVAILRALLLPAVAIALNLVIVAATFGLMKLLFQGAHPLLGGPGSIDVTSAAGIFTVLFALSLDYQVFLLTRMREGFLRSHDADDAIDHGIAHTARVVTGAALIMATVFLSFGGSGFIVPRQLGVGLGIAVLLDALVLRLFMLPAAMHLLGERGWWLPARLDRVIPRFDVEGAAGAANAPAGS